MNTLMIQHYLIFLQGIIHKVRTLKVGYFQAPPPPCAHLNNRMTSEKKIDLHFYLDALHSTSSVHTLWLVPN